MTRINILNRDTADNRYQRSVFGIDSAGKPYYDPAGVAAQDVAMPQIVDGKVVLTKGEAQVALPPERIAPPSTIALMGTSITAQNGAIDGNDGAGGWLWDATGYIHWALFQLRQRLTLVANKGVGGNTTDMMLARFDADILNMSPRPGWLVLEPGPNDQTSVTTPQTSAQSIANITAMLTKCRSAGIRVVLCTVTPSSYMVTTAMRQNRATVNEWIRKTAPVLFPGVVICDWASAVTDPTSGGASTTYFKNETGNFVHPNNRGAAIMGQYLAAALGEVLPDVDVLGGDPSDPYNLIANSFMAGNTGGLATGVSVTKLDGTAADVAVSKVPRSDGVAGEWQQVTLNSGDLQCFMQNTNAGVDWVAGTDKVRGMVEVDTDNDWVNIKSFNMIVEFYNGLGQAWAISSRSQDGDMPYNPMRGIFRTPVITIPAGTTRIRLKFMMSTTGGVGSGTFRFARGEIRKVA